MACMNRFKFCRAFKQRFGKTFTSYLNHIRIKKASELLKNPNLSVTEIAFFVGYGSFSQFMRVFKTIYGVSPKEYRRM
jgi:AraC-like DNA-binding protein